MGKRGPKPKFGKALTGAQRQKTYASGLQARIKRERAMLVRLHGQLGAIVELIEQGAPIATVVGRLMTIREDIETVLNPSE